jgi:Predicted membrane protein
MKKYSSIVVVMLMLLGGCSSSNPSDKQKVVDDKVVDQNKSDQTKIDEVENLKDHQITLEDAKAIALKDLSVTGEIVKQQEDYDDGFLYYEVDIVSGDSKYEYKIDTQGMIVSKEMEKIASGAPSTDYISAQEAQDIMLMHAQGGTITSCEFEFEGRAIYEIELVKDHREYEGAIDALSKEVLYFNQDY